MKHQFPQDRPRRVVCESGHCFVWHWCPGCERKAAIHKTHPTALHVDMLQAGDYVDVPVGRKHYDGSADTCDIQQPLGGGAAWTVSETATTHGWTESQTPPETNTKPSNRYQAA